MKAILYTTLLLLAAGCEVDNYDPPGVTLTGSVVDSQTKQLVESGGVNAGTVIRLYQDDAAQPLLLNTFPEGTFINEKLFAGNYSYRAEGPFEMLSPEPPPLVINGDMTLEIQVVPHVRLKTAIVEAGETTATIRLDFDKVAADRELNQLGIIWSTYPNPNNFTFEGGGIELVNTQDPAITEGTMEFRIEGLEPGTTYYVRGSALAANAGAYWNYSTQVELQTK